MKLIEALFALLGVGVLCFCLLLGGVTYWLVTNDTDTIYNVPRESSLILSGGQPRTLDPALSHAGPGSIPGHLFSGLVTLDTQMQVQPDLAIGWDVDETGTLYTFFLHPELRFHDGRPLTAADVIFSWERALNPATGSDTALTYLDDIVGAKSFAAGESDHLAGVRAVDAHTLAVEIDAPKVYFLAKLVMPPTFVVDSKNVAQADWEKKINGSGPFQLDKWEDDTVIILSRFNQYPRPAKLTHVVIDLGPGISLSQYEKDEIDMTGIGGNNLDRARDPNDPLAADLRTGVNLCTTMIGLNSSQPPFNDPRVRQAFNYALDREQLINTLFSNNALPAYGPLPPGMAGSQASAAPSYPFDPEYARQLLDEAGYTNRTEMAPITFTSSGYGDVSSYVTTLIYSWEETLGVDIEPVLVDPYQFFEQIYDGDPGSMYTYSWCADYPDPQNFLDILYHSQSTQNLGSYNDPEIDRLLEAARSEPNIDKRIQLYGVIETAVIEAAPAVFISHSTSAMLVKPKIRGYQLSAISIRQWDKISFCDTDC